MCMSSCNGARERTVSTLFNLPKDPPFRIGDSVCIVSPTPDRGRQGTVIEVLALLGDFVSRYRVRFDDGTVSKFFGFELELIKGSSDSMPSRQGS